jgi:excisionase family DNA binding protein
MAAFHESHALDRLLTASEVADRLAVPERWVREHTRGGLIPHVRLGRYVRYEWADVVAWLEEQKAGGAAWRKHRPARAMGEAPDNAGPSKGTGLSARAGGGV